MPAIVTQPSLSLQQRSLLDHVTTRVVAWPMNYDERFAAAMKHGGFTTNAKLSQALTDLLRRQGRLKGDKEVAEATVQSARKRIRDNGLSYYILDIAEVCGVSPYWLAHGIGDMVRAGAATPATNDSSVEVDPDLRELVRAWAMLRAPRAQAIVSEARKQLTEQVEEMNALLTEVGTAEGARADRKRPKSI